MEAGEAVEWGHWVAWVGLKVALEGGRRVGRELTDWLVRERVRGRQEAGAMEGT